VAKLKAPVRVEGITSAILVQRGHRVLLDEALAELYGVETKVLIQAVKRNLARFPPDFMFQLTDSEWASLRSQIVTSKLRRGGRRYPPYAFTEQGVAMLSSPTWSAASRNLCAPEILRAPAIRNSPSHSRSGPARFLISTNYRLCPWMTLRLDTRRCSALNLHMMRTSLSEQSPEPPLRWLCSIRLTW